MSRLTEARAALESLRSVLDRASMPISLIQLDRALQRMAQLEKVAELARLLTDDSTDPQRAEWARTHLGLAVVELDNHPETKE